MRQTIAAVGLCMLLPWAGHAASYYVTPFTIPGATSVTIAAVNDFGTAAGVYKSVSAPYGAGFVGRPGKTVTLPDIHLALFDFIPVPTGIDDTGAVLVSVLEAGEFFGYIWQGNTYQSMFLLNYGYDGLPAPFLGTGGHISYNAREGDGQFAALAGTAISATALPNNGRYPEIASINGRSQVAGQFLRLGAHVTTAAFAGTVGRIVPLLPPGATASFGGWINDVGQVAGSYQDAAGGLHGFVFSARRYVSFDMPVAPEALSVQGIDMRGRVVGTYADKVRQHAFVYTHGSVVELGKFLKRTAVHVSVSHFGRAIGISADSGTTASSYLVRCTAAASAC